MTMTRHRSLGALLGLAVGDAVGTTLEFKTRGTFDPITEMVGGGHFHLQPGQWTDDTSMALCLAESLIERREFDPADQMRRYLRWRDEGYLSSTGKCFDIGIGTARALNAFRRTGDPFSGDRSASSAGNGCLMRLAPVPIRYSNDSGRAVQMAELSAKTTHGADECIAATRVFAEMLVRAINGYTKEQIFAQPEHTIVLPARISAVVVGQSFRKKPRNAIKGTGYVVESLEAALWAFDTTENYRDCVLAAANLGDDADTTAAIAGQLAGAFYGIDGIPAAWLNRLYDTELIEKMAEDLITLQATDLTGQEA